MSHAKHTIEVEMYELHATTWKVVAKTVAEALEKINDGDADVVNTDYIEVADRYGLDGVRQVTMPDGTVLDYTQLGPQLP